MAVHGISEDADSTWALPLPTPTKGGPGSTTGKKDATMEIIKGGGAIVGKRAGDLWKNTVIAAAKPFSNDPQQEASVTKPDEEHAGEAPLQGVAKPTHIKPSNASLTNSVSASAPLTDKINWLTDDDMLRRSFPRARILQFSYPVDNNLKDVASELLRRLSDKRRGCGSGLARPIIFIGHSFGGIVISKALVIANEGGCPDVALATVGLVFRTCFPICYNPGKS